MRSHYTVVIPARNLSWAALRRLLGLTAQYGELLKRALDAETLPVVYLGGSLYFPWFTLRGTIDEVDAYTLLAEELYLLAEQPCGFPYRKSRIRANGFAMRQLLADFGFSHSELIWLKPVLLRNFGWRRIFYRYATSINRPTADNHPCFFEQSE